MKAIILAAGEGKRLRPYTLEKPKSMVEVWGQPLLERQISQLKALNINDITVVTGYKRKVIERLGVNTITNQEFQSTNMVFSLSLAAGELDQQDVIVLYGDIAYKTSHLATLIDTPLVKPTLVLGNSDWLELWSKRIENPLDDAETFIYNEDKNLLEIGQKTNSLEDVMAQYMGMLKFDGKYLQQHLLEYSEQATDERTKNLYMTDFIQAACNRNEVFTELVSGGWIEVDTVEDYALYNEQQAPAWLNDGA